MNTQDDSFPYVSQALIDALQRVFPDQAPNPGTPDHKIREQIGAVAVVRFLETKRREQQENQELGSDFS